MKILNENNVEISESDVDLSVGILREETIVKPDAKPIDNETKFAWGDEDYETIMRYVVPPDAWRIEHRIEELKRNLADTDYKILKVVEGAATLAEIAATIKQRAAWRKEINELGEKG